MRWRVLILAAILGCALASRSSAQRQGNGWFETAARALQNSQLTLPGSRPFHLTAEVIEVGEPDSDHRAKIEEYWISPDKWRRTVESPAFSQSLVVNSGNTLEKDQGDYFPSWLNRAITALFDPIPGLVMPTVIRSDPFKNLDSRVGSVCPSVETPSDRWHFCFEPHRVLLTSAFDLSTGYGAEFKDFKEFAKKQVPRQVTFDPEPGTEIQTTITQSAELQSPDEQMFVIDQSTPAVDRIKIVHVDEAAFRQLSSTSTDIDWPTVSGGLAKGGCAVYASADRTGHIREVWPGGCDNTGLQTPLREIVRKWQLRPATSNGVPVQVQARLTFAFETKVAPAPKP
jgi:hypothetical protein